MRHREGPNAHRFLRAWRKRAGLTLEQVAEAEGVGHSAVHKWEKGEVPVTLPRLENLARLYGAKHPFELLFPPGEQEQAGQLVRAWQVLQGLSPADASAWLALGERASGAAPAASAPISPPRLHAAA